MKLKLENVFNNVGEVLNFNFDFDLSAYEYNCGFPFMSPVSVKGKVKNNVGIVSLDATVSFVFSGQCDRCADDFQHEYQIEVQHFLVQQLSNGENDDYIVVGDCVLDLDELILSDILCFLPSKILCTADCKGLCSMCGTNLNASHCNCKKAVDPRMESLLQLLDN